MFLKRYACCEITYLQNLKLIETNHKKFFFETFISFFAGSFLNTPMSSCTEFCSYIEIFKTDFFFQETNSSHLGDGSFVTL